MRDRPDGTIEEEYTSYTSRRLLFIAVFIVLSTLMFFVSLLVGTRDLSLADVYTYFFNHLAGVTYDPVGQAAEWFDDNLIWNYRVPRAAFAILAGATLAVAGATMQSVMKNPLADPYTTGISSGALLGVALAMVLGFTIGGGAVNDLGTLTNAMVFAMIPVLFIYLLSPVLNKSPSILILAGTAVSYLFSSLTSILLVTTDADTLAGVYQWQVGKLSEVTWESIPLVLVLCIAGSVFLTSIANKLNLMSLDDKDAKALGLDSERLRLACLVILSFMASSVICYAGIIGFIGLVTPHIVRILIGSDYRFVIPGSFFFGAAFLLFCDIISRSLDVTAVVPVGVVTSMIGAPIFLYLIIRNKREVW